MRLRILSTVLYLLFLGLCAGPVLAQGEDETSADVSAKIIEPVSVSAVGTEGLYFGNLKTSAHDGTITIDAETNDYGAVTGGITTNNPNQDRHAASFDVTGDPGLQFQVAISGSETTSPGVLSNLHIYPEYHVLDSEGNATFRVGGTLALVANIHNFKIYKSDIAVTVSYN